MNKGALARKPTSHFDVVPLLEWDFQLWMSTAGTQTRLIIHYSNIQRLS